MYFQNYRLSKNWLDHSPKRGVSEHSSTVNLLNGLLALAKSAWENLCHIFPSLSEEIVPKISPILKFEILRVFVKTLTTKTLFRIVIVCSLLFSCNYLKRENFFRQFSVPFMGSTSNFKHFSKKQDRHS